VRDLLEVRDELVEMVEQPYEAEDVLQQLLADYPTLIAGIRTRKRGNAGCW
jgi:hypothetical protein